MEFLNFVAKKENEMGRQIKDLDELDQIQIDYKKRSILKFNFFGNVR